MATVTSAVIAGLGAVGNAASAIKQTKLAKDAQAAQKQAAQNLAAVRELNPYKAVQTPTIGTKMAMENINQGASDYLSALQGAGSEGVIGGVTGLNKSTRDAYLEAGANLDEMKFQRDAAEAGAQVGINARQAARDYDRNMMSLEGAQMAEADANYNRNRNIESAFAGLSSGIGGFANTDKYDYLTPAGQKRLRRKLKFKPPTDEYLQSEDPMSVPV